MSSSDAPRTRKARGCGAFVIRLAAIAHGAPLAQEARMGFMALALNGRRRWAGGRDLTALGGMLAGSTNPRERSAAELSVASVTGVGQRQVELGQQGPDHVGHTRLAVQGEAVDVWASH